MELVSCLGDLSCVVTMAGCHGAEAFHFQTCRLQSHLFIGGAGLNRNFGFGTCFVTQLLGRVSERAVHVGNSLEMTHCDGRGDKKLAFAMVICLPSAYIDFG